VRRFLIASAFFLACGLPVTAWVMTSQVQLPAAMTLVGGHEKGTSSKDQAKDKGEAQKGVDKSQQQHEKMGQSKAEAPKAQGESRPPEQAKAKQVEAKPKAIASPKMEKQQPEKVEKQQPKKVEKQQPEESKAPKKPVQATKSPAAPAAQQAPPVQAAAAGSSTAASAPGLPKTGLYQAAVRQQDPWIWATGLAAILLVLVSVSVLLRTRATASRRR